MSLNVLIVPDKFKGTISAGAAAEAMARGWRRVWPRDRLRLVPMSDGGDGFGEAISRFLGARVRVLRTVDAAHRPCAVRWWWETRTRTALLESARIVGLAMLPPKVYHPFDLDTAGLGGALETLAAKGARRCLIGLGGSATNDGGFGLARALGWRFLDRDGLEIVQWSGLDGLVHLRAPRSPRRFEELVAAVDVQNRLLGPRGATRTYGPQKGLRSRDLPRAEACLRRLARVVEQELGRDYAARPGAGAAGGLGFGLLAFLGAKVAGGFEQFAGYAALDRCLDWADLVLTGEGSLDEQTLMGKGVGRIADCCRRRRLPCIALAGSLKARPGIQKTFTQAHALTELVSLERAKAEPASSLERLAERIAGDYAKSKVHPPSPRLRRTSRPPS